MHMRLIPPATTTTMAAVLLLVLGLSACGDSTESDQSAQSAATTQSGSWVASTPSSSIPAEPDGQSSSADPSAPTAPVPGAYPEAGGAIPEGSTELEPNVSSQTGLMGVEVHSPSGNVRCILVESLQYGGCGSDAVGESGALGPDTSKSDFPAPGETPTINFASFGENRESWPTSGNRTEPIDSPILIEQHEAPFGLHNEGADEVHVLEYGRTAYYGRFVCASERNGMTCWDSVTGHGAFLNKATIEVF
jgi:hypothetical protein